MSTDNTDNEPELSPDEKERIEQLRVDMAAYQRALEQEFEERQKTQPEQVIQNTLEFFEGQTANAAAQIVHLMQYSSSDATRLAASKFIIDRVFKGAVDGTEDPIKKILSQMMNGTEEVTN